MPVIEKIDGYMLCVQVHDAKTKQVLGHAFVKPRHLMGNSLTLDDLAFEAWKSLLQVGTNGAKTTADLAYDYAEAFMARRIAASR